MTQPTEEIQVAAARSRWRADLLAVHADEIERLAGDDQGSVAQGLLLDATSKKAEGTIHLDLAEAEVALSVAKQDRNDNPKDERVQRRYAQAAQALVDLRSYWRGIDEMVGNRRFAMALDNFPEPTDEEVLASHGGDS